MTDLHKKFDDIWPSDFETSPVWEFALDRETEGELVRPVFGLPVSDLGNRFVGTSVRLANGESLPAMITNVSTTDSYRTRHFIALHIFKNEWFDLARYHDVDVKRNGPSGLARFLGLPVEEVFPISYDLRPCCVGDPDALAGKFEIEPKVKLNDEQLRELALSS